MFMKTKLFLLMCVFGALIGCDRDNLPSDEQTNNEHDSSLFQENFGNAINRTIIGNVIDSNQNPIENVIISIGNDQILTDENGVFILENAQINERFAFVKAEKQGYIHGSRAFVPSNGSNKVSIMLLEETVAGTTSSGSDATISLTNGASVSLQGEYIKEDGTAYAGSLDVIIHHLDPTDEMVNLQMPGMLYAANSNDEERMLMTLGMLAVELKGTGGEDLNLAEGSTAEIKIPVDASLMSSAPSTIPLWYFDETNGYWIEEGQATLEGNYYVGTVSHFSFWNCDIPAEAINLCVNVINEDETPFANTRVTITSTTFGTRSGYTNELGEVCGLVPSGEPLEINVYDFAICGSNVIYTASIGPFNADASETVVITENSNIINESVLGTFTDCNNTPIANGYVVLNYGDQQFFDVVEDGTFEINMLRCSSEDTFTIEAIDISNLQTSGEINYTFSTPQTNLGNLAACDSVTEFIQYTVDTDETVFIATNIQATFGDANSGASGTSLNISAFRDGGSNDCFYLFGNLNGPPHTGIYDNLDFQNQNDTGINIGECISISQTNNNIVYNVTALGDVGEYIDINFSGIYEDYNGNPHSITGVIHVLRD